MLFSPAAPVLDLRNTKVTSDVDLKDTFHKLHLCPEDVNIHPEECPNSRKRAKRSKKSKEVSDSDTFEEEQVNPRHRTSIKERECSTIPGSASATQIALSH